MLSKDWSWRTHRGRGNINIANNDLPYAAIGRATIITNAAGSPRGTTVRHPSVRLASIAVGAVIYVRYQLQDGTYVANLLTSKTRISGLRNVSTPKAELLGCTMLINMMDYLLRNLEIHYERRIVLTDSTVVLGQIKKPSCMYDGQLGGKIDQIQQMERDHNLEFYHVPREHNVADMVTRQTSTVADPDKPNFVSRTLQKRYVR